MATILESGKLQLSPEEETSSRGAADHLHDSCHAAALGGNLSNLDRMLEHIQDEIRLRNQRQ